MERGRRLVHPTLLLRPEVFTRPHGPTPAAEGIRVSAVALQIHVPGCESPPEAILTEPASLTMILIWLASKCTIIQSLILILQILEETVLECSSPALDAKDDDGHDDAEQDDGESHDQAVDVLIIVEEFRDDIFVVSCYGRAGGDERQQCEGKEIFDHIIMGCDII